MPELRETNKHVSVDYRNDAVEPALRQRLLDVEHERFRLSETGGLDDDHLGSDFLDDLVDRCFKLAEQRAANTSAAQLGDPHVLAFNHFRVDGDLPEFIHHDGDLRRSRPQNVTEQRGLAAAERTGHERDGGAKHVKNDEARMTNDELMTKHE